MKNEMKYLHFPLEIKEVNEDEGTIEGYASVFGNIDLGYDVVAKGAFKKTIKDNKGKFPILADHDPRKQIGWNIEAKEDDYGLYVKGSLDIKNNQLAKERYSLAKKAMEIKADFGLSIGYITVKSEPDKENPVIRHLKELRLMEYSFVTFPMNQMAKVTGAKMDDDELNLTIAKMIELGKTRKDISDLLMKSIEPKQDFHSINDSVNKLIKTIRGE